MWLIWNIRQNNLKWILILLILIHKGLTENSSCPIEWVSGGNSCFFIGDHLTTWDDARNFCRKIGGDLVAIYNETTQQVFEPFLPEKDWFLKGLWIGLNDLQSPGVFEWADGSPPTYTDWASEMPGWNAENATGSCVTVDIESRKWKINNCTDENGFVCEAHNLTTPLTTDKLGRCDEPEMKSFLGSCYWTIPGSDGWLAANKWCETEGGKLATITNSLENIFLFEIVRNATEAHWIGCRVDDNGALFWEAATTNNYSNWDGMPSMDANMCAVMERHGKWMMQPCHAELPSAICKKSIPIQNLTANVVPSGKEEVNVTDECAVGWKRSEDRCYLVVKDPLTWEAARNQCLTLRAELVHIFSQEDEESVLNLFKNESSIKSTALQNFWLGLFNTSAQTGSYWSDGSFANYTNWKDFNNSTDELRCGTFEVSSSQWSNALCSSLFPFICQAQIGIRMVNESSCEGTTCQSTEKTMVVTNLMTTQENVANDCLPRWKRFGDNCYIFIGKHINNRSNWTAANSNCRSVGGNLASIHSEAQYLFILNEMELEGLTRVWIGLRNSNGQLQYTDYTPVNYTDWSVLEGHYAQKSGCVKIETQTVKGKWVTTDCRLSMAYVCQDFQNGTTMLPPTPFTNPPPTPVENKPSTETSSNSTMDYSDIDDDYNNNEFEQNVTQPEDTEVVVNIVPQITTTVNDETVQTISTPGDSLTPAENDDTETSNDGLVTVQCDTSGTNMTGGAIAGIVLSCILGTALVIAVTLYLHQRRLAAQYAGGKFSFDNALYNPHGDHIQLDTNMPNR